MVEDTLIRPKIAGPCLRKWTLRFTKDHSSNTHYSNLAYGVFSEWRSQSFSVGVYVPCENAAENGASRSLFSGPFPPHPNRGPCRFGLLPQASTVFEPPCASWWSDGEGLFFFFPEMLIFLAKSFHCCRLKGDILRIEVKCECVCFQ